MSLDDETTRPEPPEDMESDAAAEWEAICDAIQRAGHPVREADRSLLTLYCRLWIINRDCYAHVRKFGPIIMYPNNVPGASPQYKTFEQTAKQLRGVLAELGATPKSRKFDAAAAEKSPDPAETADLPL